MTTTPLQLAPVVDRPRLVTRALMLRFVSIIASSLSFFFPLAVVPLLAGTASPVAGGLANGALLAATVVGELLSPSLMHRFGNRGVLAAGLVLLGAPTLLLSVADSTAVLVSVGAIRGIGFALAIVAGGAITAALLPAQRRGEGLAVAGLVSAVPALLALPLGVMITTMIGPDLVFAIAAAAPLLALATVPALPRRSTPARPDDDATRAPSGIIAGLRSGTLMRPALVFAASAVVAGVVVTCLPGALTGGAASIAPAVLLLQPAATAVGRWIAGRYGDHGGHRRILAPGIILAAVGMAAMAATSSVTLVLAGAAAFGLAFGALQNATIAAMYDGATEEQYGTVSAIWNAGYDGGMALGALAISALSAMIGDSPAFLALALALPAGLLLTRRPRHA